MTNEPKELAAAPAPAEPKVANDAKDFLALAREFCSVTETPSGNLEWHFDGDDMEASARDVVSRAPVTPPLPEAVKDYHPGVSGTAAIEEIREREDALRRALEIIAVGDSKDPVTDAGDELVALGYWNGEAVRQYRAAAPSHPPATPTVAVQAEPDTSPTKQGLESILLAFVRIALANPNEVLMHQLDRLIAYYEGDKFCRMLKQMERQVRAPDRRNTTPVTRLIPSHPKPAAPATAADAVSDEIAAAARNAYFGGGRHGYPNFATLAEPAKANWRKVAVAVLALRSGASAQPAEPVHFRALLAEAQRPQQIKTDLHVVGFRTRKAADSWVAEQKDFKGWEYTVEALYNRAGAAQPAGGAE